MQPTNVRPARHRLRPALPLYPRGRAHSAARRGAAGPFYTHSTHAPHNITPAPRCPGAAAFKSRLGPLASALVAPTTPLSFVLLRLPLTRHPCAALLPPFLFALVGFATAR